MAGQESEDNSGRSCGAQCYRWQPCNRVGKEEGIPLDLPIIELYYKDDELHDPMINEYHARVLGWATDEQLKDMDRQAHKINNILQPFLTVSVLSW